MIEKTLSKLTALITKDSLSESDVVYTLSLIRKIIEKHEEKQKFSLLNFYCDWVLHSSITRSPSGLEMLRKIQETIIVDGSIDPLLLSGKITSILSFYTLRKELEAFLEEFNLPLDIIKKIEMWAKFIFSIVEIVREYPLSFLDYKKYKEIEKIYNDMKEKPIKPDMWIEELSLTKVNFSSILKKRLLDDKEVPCWKLKMSETTTMIGPLIAESLIMEVS